MKVGVVSLSVGLGEFEVQLVPNLNYSVDKFLLHGRSVERSRSDAKLLFAS